MKFNKKKRFNTVESYAACICMMSTCSCSCGCGSDRSLDAKRSSSDFSGSYNEQRYDSQNSMMIG